MAIKFKTKATSFMLAFILVIMGFGEISVLKTKSVLASDENVAEAILTDDFKTSNFTEVRMGQNSAVKYTNRGGTRAWYLDPASGQNSSFMYFNLSDSFAKEIKDGTVFEFEIEYFSQGEGYFRVVYDSQDKQDKRGKLIQTGKTNTWETAKITIDDAYFGNRLLDKYDFLLSIQANRTSTATATVFSPAEVPIRRVKVTKYEKRNPVTLKYDILEPGKNFAWYSEEKIVYNYLKNTTDKEQIIELLGFATAASGELKWQGKQEVTLAPFEEKTVTMNIDTNWCDLYDYHAVIVGDGFRSEFAPQRFAILKTDPDGIQNEKYFFNVHVENYVENSEEMAKVMRMSNAQGLRYTFGWKFIQWSKNDMPGFPENRRKSNQYFTDNGLTILDCLNQLPGNVDFPKTPEEEAEYLNAIEIIVNNMPEGTLFEIWNEPWVSLMTKGVDSPDADTFARFTKITAEKIKEVRPDAKVGIYSAHGMDRKDTFGSFQEGMSSEHKPWENADAFAFHPYRRDAYELSNMATEVIPKWADEFKKYGKDDIELWYTEAGFSLIESTIGKEEIKAAFNTRKYLYLQGLDLVDLYSTYNFEQKGMDQKNREYMFGMVTPGIPLERDVYNGFFLATESFVATTALNYLMAQVEPAGDYSDGNLMAYKYNSNKFGKDIVAMWDKLGDQRRKVNLGTNEITYFDINGNETKLTSNDGTYTFDITHQPFYLMGDIKKVEYLEVPDFEIEKKENTLVKGDILEVVINQNIDGRFTVTPEMPKYITLRENKGFSEKQAKLYFDINEEFENDTYIYLDIKDENNNLVQKIAVKCKMPEYALTSAVMSHLGEGDNLNRWTLDIKVTNASSTYLKRGYIKFNSPENFAKIKPVNLGPIPPGMTAEVTVNCPEITAKGMYNINYDVVLDDGNTYNFDKIVDFAVINEVKNEIVIDGVIGKDEWDRGSAMYVNSIEQIVGYEDWGGKSDLSGFFAVSWDYDNFYLCAEVTDNIFHQDQTDVKNMQLGDSIMFGLYDAIDVYLVAGQGNTDYHEIGLGLMNGEPKAYRSKAQIYDSIAVGDMTDLCDVAIKQDGNKTVYEFKCPWEQLLGYELNPKVGDVLYFASLINENDGEGKRGTMKFADGFGSFTKNVELFSKIRFVD